MTLIDDLCDGCGRRFDPMGDPLLTRHPEIGEYAVLCATCESKSHASADTETLAEVLAAHQWHHTRDTHCACGFRTPLAQLAAEGYIAHVAALVESHFAARIVQARAGEGALRERVEALCDEFDEISRTPRKWMAYPSARRMLDAALTASDGTSDGPASVPDADTADPS